MLVMLLVVSYKLNYQWREHFSMTQHYKAEMEKSMNALGYLLPEFVKKRVSQGERVLTQEQGRVSVLFCNICKLTYWTLPVQ